MVAEGVFTTGSMTSYCTAGEVMKVLAGYDLSAFGAEAELLTRVRELLPLTKGMVDTCAGRDFGWHGDETVWLDGTGTDCVDLAEASVAPPVVVREVQVDGQTVAATQYRAYAQTGLVRLKPRSAPATFAAGLQNVAVALDWGYEATPADIALAQAKLTAGELLAELGGEGGAVQETRIGDYAVRYAAGGRYAEAVARLCQEAELMIRRYRRVRIVAV